jgi:hypothetical protein
VKVVPFEKERDMLDKPLRNAVTYLGDIVSPIDDMWEFEE